MHHFRVAHGPKRQMTQGRQAWPQALPVIWPYNKLTMDCHRREISFQTHQLGREATRRRSVGVLPRVRFGSIMMSFMPGWPCQYLTSFTNGMHVLVQQSLEVYDTQTVRIRSIRMNVLLPKTRSVRMSLEVYEFWNNFEKNFLKILKKNSTFETKMPEYYNQFQKHSNFDWRLIDFWV